MVKSPELAALSALKSKTNTVGLLTEIEVVSGVVL
jgi:hypothetical protein